MPGPDGLSQYERGCRLPPGSTSRPVASIVVVASVQRFADGNDALVPDADIGFVGFAGGCNGAITNDGIESGQRATSSIQQRRVHTDNY